MEDPNDLYDDFEEKAAEIYNGVHELKEYLEKHKKSLGIHQFEIAFQILERFQEDLEQDLHLIF